MNRAITTRFGRRLLAGLLTAALGGCLGGGGGGGGDPAGSGGEKPGNVTTPGSGSGTSGGNNTGGAGSGGNTAAGAKWTYLVYMSADNNLSSAALKDINEMEKIGSSSDVNIVVQADFSQQYSPGVYSGAPVTLRGRIERDSNFNQISSPLQSAGANLDMGKGQTLAEFINWAKQTYPAQNYALVLWSHGAGWKISRATGGLQRGALQDETSGSLMRLPEIAGAVQQSGIKFGLINFDACLMGMVEVARHLQHGASYLVASEETEPGDGDDYEHTLARLTANPDMSALELGRTIAETYKQFYQQENRTNVTKSVLDLAQYPQFDSRFQDVASYLQANIGTLRAAIQSARDEAARYQYPYNRDLGDFIARLKGKISDNTLQAKLDQLETARSTMVVSNQVFLQDPGASNARSTGVAIFLPRRDEISSNDLGYYLSDIATNGDKWGQFNNVLINGDAAGGGGESGNFQQTANGNFVFYIKWDNPAVDLDLYIYEPQNLVSPWMGVVSLNGFMSADSSAVGKQEEYYAAAETVEKGQYDVFVNYYEGSQPTTVRLYYADPNNGVQLSEVGAAQLDRSQPAPELTWPTLDFDYVTLLDNPYSDWWYAGQDTRALLPGRQRSQTLQAGNKTVRLHLLQRRAVKQSQTRRDAASEQLLQQRMAGLKLQAGLR